MKNCPMCRAEMDDDERICPQCPYKEPVKEPVTALDFFNRGVERQKKGKTNEAMEDLFKAQEMDPQMISAHFWLAKVYADKGAFWWTNGRPGEARHWFLRSVQTWPNPTVFNQKAMHGLTYNMDKEALEDASKALEMDPAFFPAYITRANVYHKLGNIDLAIADNTKAIELAPDYALAYRNRAREYLTQKDYPKAIADFDQAIRLDPANASAYCDRANAQVQLKDYEKAIADCNEAIRLDPQLTLAREHLAKLLDITGKNDGVSGDQPRSRPGKWWEFWR